MRNEGRITVFMSLMLSVILLLCVTAFKVASVSAAKEKAAIAVRSSISSVKARYNRYIFDHYHILLFDKTLAGEGEAALEEYMVQELEQNLGKGFNVESLAVRDFNMICEEGLSEFKRQIREAMKYEIVEYGAEKIRGVTKGEDGSLSPEQEEELSAAEQAEKEGAETQDEASGTDEKPAVSAGGKTKDPRKFTRKLSKSGLLKLVAPEDLEINEAEYDIGSGPSLTTGGFFPDFVFLQKDFDDVKDMRQDLTEGSGWDNALVNAGALITYARRYFNSAVDHDKNKETVFDFEMEYLIAGHDSDKENLQTVVISLSGLRFPFCYACLRKDAERMAQVRAIARGLSLITPVPASVYRVLIAGCWAYAESIAECRSLLAGKRLSFVKKKSNWVTDIKNLPGTVKTDVPEDKKGLAYEDYLMILMAIKQEKVCYRMLDLMEFNTKQKEEDFEMEHAAYGLTVDASIAFGGQSRGFSETGEY